MCFSASASFTSAAIIGIIGVFTLAKAKKRCQWAFASIPLLFALQQCAEGFVWLTQRGVIPDPHAWSARIFLFFAFGVWPAITAYALAKLERRPMRAWVLHALAATGTLFSLYCVYTFYSIPITVSSTTENIVYQFTLPLFFSGKTSLFFYLLVTVVPFFISSVHGMWLLGMALIGSLILSLTVWAFAFVSVWCFFAALSSSAIFYMVTRQE